MECITIALFALSAISAALLSLKGKDHQIIASLLAWVSVGMLALNFIFMCGLTASAFVLLMYLVAGYIGCGILLDQDTAWPRSVAVVYLLIGVGLYFAALWVSIRPLIVITVVLVVGLVAGVSTGRYLLCENKKIKQATFVILLVLLCGLLLVTVLIHENLFDLGDSSPWGEDYLVAFGVLIEIGFCVLPLAVCAFLAAKSFFHSGDMVDVGLWIVLAIVLPTLLFAGYASVALLVFVLAAIVSAANGEHRFEKVLPLVGVAIVCVALLVLSWSSRIEQWLSVYADPLGAGWVYSVFLSSVQMGGLFGGGQEALVQIGELYGGVAYELVLAGLFGCLGLVGMLAVAVCFVVLAIHAVRNYRSSEGIQALCAFVPGICLAGMALWNALYVFHVVPLPSMLVPFISFGAGSVFASAFLAALQITAEAHEPTTTFRFPYVLSSK